MRREVVPGIVEWFTKTQRQQKEIDDEYTTRLRVEKVEEETRKAKTAVRGRGSRKGKKKEKEKVYGGGEGTTTKSKCARPRVKSIRQLVLSPKKKKKKTQHVLNLLNSFNITLNRKVTIYIILKIFRLYRRFPEEMPNPGKCRISSIYI